MQKFMKGTLDAFRLPSRMDGLMTPTFYIKQNDTSPAIRSNLLDSAGAAINVTGATVRFSMKDQYGQIVVDNQLATIIEYANGVVEYDWQAGDTANSGNHYAEFEITFDNGRVQTVPNDSDILVKIAPEVG